VHVAKGGCSGMHYEMTLDEEKRATQWWSAMECNFLSTAIACPIFAARRWILVAV